MKTKKSQNVQLNNLQRELVTEHYSLVDKTLNSIRTRLPSHADIDELHSAGVSGLVDAATKLNPKKTKSFGAYASLRIRGAIMDELRKLDYMPRSARQDAKKINHTREDLEDKLGRNATDEEVRYAMGLSRKQYTKVMRRTQNISFISLNDDSSKDGETRNLGDVIPDENAHTAIDKIEEQELSVMLKQKMLGLPERQRKILESYYFEEKKLADIAEDFDVSEARICQIHAQALKALKSSIAKSN